MSAEQWGNFLVWKILTQLVTRSVACCSRLEKKHWRVLPFRIPPQSRAGRTKNDHQFCFQLVPLQLV